MTTRIHRSSTSSSSRCGLLLLLINIMFILSSFRRGQCATAAATTPPTFNKPSSLLPPAVTAASSSSSSAFKKKSSPSSVSRKNTTHHDDDDHGDDYDAISASETADTADTASSSSTSSSTQSSPPASVHGPAVVGSPYSISSSSSNSASVPLFRIWPCGDDLDKRLVKLTLPLMAVFSVLPILMAIDLFWVNQISSGAPGNGNSGNSVVALAVAGHAAGKQVFFLAQGITMFLPSVAATLISKAHASDDRQVLQDAVGQAITVAVVLGILVQVLALLNLDTLLGSVLSKDAPAYAFARPYLRVRCFAFLPILLAMVGFSAFRGILDSVTPVKITMLVAVVNVILAPLLIITFHMGVTGSALASVLSETVGACVYLILLCKHDLINPTQMFQDAISYSHGNVQKWWIKTKPLLQAGAAFQLKSLATNMAFVSIARVVQGSDETGVSASANAMATQLFQLGSVALASASMVTQTLVPNEMVVHKMIVMDEHGNEKIHTFGGPRHARNTVNRLFAWGLVLGFATCFFQLALLVPMMQQSTPLQEVRDASWIPCILASLGQIINGPVFIGEGIMIGTGSFLQLSIITALSSLACVVALKLYLAKYGVNGVWLGFAVWNLLRLVGVYVHDRINGPLAPRKMTQAEAREKEH